MRTLLLVHAHPDDEVIGTGATMAKYAADGVKVVLVTCTLGEEGEVLVEDLAHLAVTHEDNLGQHRITELDAATKALGIAEFRFLGGPGRYRDSGMMGEPSNDKPESFWATPIEEPTRDLAGIIRELRPEVVITYDEFGGYGHPDHVRAHQVTVAAVDAALDPAYAPELGEPFQVPKLYYTVIAKSWLQAGIDAMKEAGLPNFFEVDSADDLPFGVPDDQLNAVIDGSAFIDNKIEAMRAHATQIAQEGGFLALSDGIGRSVMGMEGYSLARGASGPLDDEGHETDLFAGLDEPAG